MLDHESSSKNPVYRVSETQLLFTSPNKNICTTDSVTMGADHFSKSIPTQPCILETFDRCSSVSSEDFCYVATQRYTALQIRDMKLAINAVTGV